MGIRCKDLKEYIIKPSLEGIGLYSEAAENLLLGTAAVESRMGYYLKQVGGGPALGVFQMEPATHDDLWSNYLAYSKKKPRLLGIWIHEKKYTSIPSAADMVYDLQYATIMARLQYFRQPEALPDASDVEGLARYWKIFYNSSAGKGTVEGFMESYERYVL